MSKTMILNYYNERKGIGTVGVARCVSRNTTWIEVSVGVGDQQGYAAAAFARP